MKYQSTILLFLFGRVMTIFRDVDAIPPVGGQHKNNVINVNDLFRSTPY